MKIYRGRFYVDDNLITENFFYEDDPTSMAWLNHFKEDTRRNPHPLAKFEVIEFEQVGNVEVVTPRARRNPI